MLVITSNKRHHTIVVMYNQQLRLQKRGGSEKIKMEMMTVGTILFIYAEHITRAEYMRMAFYAQRLAKSATRLWHEYRITHIKLWDVITHPYPQVSYTTVKRGHV